MTELSIVGLKAVMSWLSKTVAGTLVSQIVIFTGQAVLVRKTTNLEQIATRLSQQDQKINKLLLKIEREAESHFNSGIDFLYDASDCNIKKNRDILVNDARFAFTKAAHTEESFYVKGLSEVMVSICFSILDEKNNQLKWASRAYHTLEKLSEILLRELKITAEQNDSISYESFKKELDSIFKLMKTLLNFLKRNSFPKFKSKSSKMLKTPGFEELREKFAPPSKTKQEVVSVEDTQDYDEPERESLDLQKDMQFLYP
ncbi:MAG TPA: hypothetical protein VF599_01000 [Pyrinomonadaceae bacterium]|jgi:hypothetical protein